MEELKKQMEILQNSIKLKDDQITTLKDSLDLKDDHIKTLEDSINMKEEKIDTLEKTIKLKAEQLESVSSKSEANNPEAEKRVQELEKEIVILNEELVKADEDIEKLMADNDELRQNAGGTGADGPKIIDFTNIEITKEQIIEKMRNILQNALHNVTITVPTIEDLQDLYLYEVRSSVNMKISCLINPGIDLHAELLEEFESLDNISLRTNEEQDRWVIIRDGEELLFAAIGNSENNHLAFHTRDGKHIKLLNSLIMESWLRSRKI